MIHMTPACTSPGMYIHYMYLNNRHMYYNNRHNYTPYTAHVHISHTTPIIMIHYSVPRLSTPSSDLYLQSTAEMAQVCITIIDTIIHNYTEYTH
jgi:hypothetical protein